MDGQYFLLGQKAMVCFRKYAYQICCIVSMIFTLAPVIIIEDEPYEKKLQNLLQTYIYSMI